MRELSNVLQRAANCLLTQEERRALMRAPAEELGRALRRKSRRYVGGSIPIALGFVGMAYSFDSSEDRVAFFVVLGCSALYVSTFVVSHLRLCQLLRRFETESEQ